jgi:hypothetical protein
MPDRVLPDLIATWRLRRTEIGQKSQNRTSAASLREFVEVMNYQTRMLISHVGEQDPEFWSAVAELATNAATLTTPGAKIFADGQDRTQL